MSAYRFDLADGPYSVILHFAEIYFNSPNSRIFDVVVEDTLVLKDYDIYLEAGSFVASSKAFQTTVTDGRLDIEFSATVDAAKISAIEIYTVAAGPLLSVTPATLEFGSQAISQNIIIKNIGGDTLNWSAVEKPDESWITNLTPSSGTLTASQCDTIAVIIDRTGLADGFYTGNVNVVSNAGNQNVAVNMSVSSIPTFTQRVNCGSNVNYIDGNNNTWLADQAYSPGSWGYVGGNIFITPDQIANTGDDPLYQSERWFESLSYRFDVPNGLYLVILHFAEIYYNSPGIRVFDVSLEGNPVIKNYDIYAEQGHDVAVTKNFQVNVADNRLDVDFTSSRDAAKISAIEVISMSNEPVLAVNPTTLDFGSAIATMNFTITNNGGDTLSWTAKDMQSQPWLISIVPDSGSLVGGATATVAVSVDRTGLADGSYTTTISVMSNGGSQDVIVNMSVSSTPLYSQRVNCGSSTSYTDVNQNSWDADQPYSSNSWGYIGGNVYATAHPIDNTNDDQLFQTERWGLGGYQFDVANGEYEVTLLFAEIYLSSPGTRVFSVEIEGVVVLVDYDIFAEVGHDFAVSKTYVVTVTDNQLNINFVSSIEDPKISAIQVIESNQPGMENRSGNIASLNYQPDKPGSFQLHQNYPNPFNPTTNISFEIPRNCYVKLIIYNGTGQVVRELIDDNFNAGIHLIGWDAVDKLGQQVRSGIYFAVLQAGEYRQMIRMTLLK